MIISYSKDKVLSTIVKIGMAVDATTDGSLVMVHLDFQSNPEVDFQSNPEVAPIEFLLTPNAAMKLCRILQERCESLSQKKNIH